MTDTEELDPKIRESNLDELLRPTGDSIDSLTLSRVTCGTLSLCQFAKLSLLDGGDGEAELYDVLAFLFIHAEPQDRVRGLLFSEGDQFRDAVLDFGGQFGFDAFQKLSDKVTGMLTDATSGMVEVDDMELEATEQKKTLGEE
jgi:hypothetical protein